MHKQNKHQRSSSGEARYLVLEVKGPMMRVHTQPQQRLQDSVDKLGGTIVNIPAAS